MSWPSACPIFAAMPEPAGSACVVLDDGLVVPVVARARPAATRWLCRRVLDFDIATVFSLNLRRQGRENPVSIGSESQGGNPRTSELLHR